MTKSIAFAFGRFNPPTIGHEKLMDMTRGANRNYRIYASQTQDAKRNPLTHTKKVKYMKDMFPVHRRKISRDKLTTAIDVLVRLYKEKYTDVIMIAGSDRVAEFDKLLQQYNGKKAKHGFYKFKSIRVVSAGERDPDAEGLSGMSASKMRKAAQDNKFGAFKQGLPKKYKGRELFQAVQKAMGTRTFREFNEMTEAGVDPGNGAIFLSDKAVIVGQTHGKPVKLSSEILKKVQAIATKYGAWYEGDGKDALHTKGVIDNYKGSFDNDLFAESVSSYPYEFIYNIMSNVEENKTYDQIGADPDKTIAEQILVNQKVHNFFPSRKYDGSILLKFLKAISEKQYNFVEMSEQPATKENVKNFLMTGEKLMWPENWDSYPNKAGKIAKAATDQRDKFLASRKEGAYIVGSGHLISIQQLSGKQIDEAKKGPSETEQDKDDFGMAEYPLQLHPDDDDGDWVTGDPAKPIEWKFKGDPIKTANKKVVKDRRVWHKDPKTSDDWKESIDEAVLQPDSPSVGPGLELKKKVVFFDKKLKKKDTGPTPADQLLPKNTVRRIESKLPSNLQKLVHKPKPKSKEIKDVLDDMKIGTTEAYQQSDASKEFQARMARRKAQIGRPKEPEKLSFFLKRARKAGYKVKKEDEETYSQRISKPVAMGNSSGVGGTTVMPKVSDGATEIDEVIFNRRAYDAAAKWYGKFKKRGDKPGVALHKAAGMVRGVKDKALQTHLSKAKLL